MKKAIFKITDKGKLSEKKLAEGLAYVEKVKETQKVIDVKQTEKEIVITMEN